MSNQAPAVTDVLDPAVLLGVLAQIQAGDFTARMPLDWTGVPGKIADGLNEAIIANEAFGAELARISRKLGACVVGQRRVAERPDRRAGASHQRDAARHRSRRIEEKHIERLGVEMSGIGRLPKQHHCLLCPFGTDGRAAPPRHQIVEHTSVRRVVVDDQRAQRPTTTALTAAVVCTCLFTTEVTSREASTMLLAASNTTDSKAAPPINPARDRTDFLEPRAWDPICPCRQISRSERTVSAGRHVARVAGRGQYSAGKA